jgi:hypothetical protein
VLAHCGAVADAVGQQLELSVREDHWLVGFG